MKKVLSSLLAILLPAVALAQNPPYIIQTPGASVNNGSMSGYSGSALVDGKGQLYINSLGTPIPVSQAAGAEMTPIAMVTVLPTAIPTAYSTPLAILSGAKTMTVDNASENQEVWCNYGGGTATHFSVPAGSIYTDNAGTRGDTISTGIACIHPGSTPSAGSLKIYGSK